MKKILPIILSCLFFNSCDRKPDPITNPPYGDVVIEVNSECIPFRVSYEKDWDQGRIEEIVSANYWSFSWVGKERDEVFLMVEDISSSGSYPNGVTKLVEINVSYKDEIIASAVELFDHTNDRCMIDGVSIP